MSDEKYMPEKMADFFNKRVNGYEVHMKELDKSGEFYNMIPSVIVPTTKAVQVLDLGCGTGLEIQGILERAPNAQITCIDMAEGMLEELKRKYSLYSRQLNIVTGSYLEVSFPKCYFDYVIAVQTMHHWQEDTKIKLYQKIWNSLKTGSLYIEADYVVNEQEEEERLNKYKEIQKSGVLREGELYHIDIPFSVKTQRRLFKKAGFNVADIIYEKGNGAIFVVRK